MGADTTGAWPVLFAGFAGLGGAGLGLIYGLTVGAVRGWRLVPFGAVLLGISGAAVGLTQSDRSIASFLGSVGAVTGLAIGAAVGAVESLGRALRATRPAPAGLKLLAVGGSWVIAAVGALTIAEWPGDVGESVCGVWGCFPPLQALLAMHVFWCVVLACFVWSVATWRPRALYFTGVALLIVGGSCLVAIVARDLSEWVSRMPEEYQAYWPRRVAYTLATHSDLPVVQALLAGVVCAIAGRKTGRRPVRRDRACETISGSGR
ncbi:hypothetical protein [Fimbriiglobus ruber]|uniref:Uncharacterized protein n=1 Tax=Fimbriiglobus ruber TaxID=1908690 RepID=A0A225E8B8_9BACT|nr:hypothetical protein [Fimbriiglobus ruber]OWK47018.1 hypothetical protein FRUB_00717 [Fimbriiglobus ruber]